MPDSNDNKKSDHSEGTWRQVFADMRAAFGFRSVAKGAPPRTPPSKNVYETPTSHEPVPRSDLQEKIEERAEIFYEDDVIAANTIPATEAVPASRTRLPLYAWRRFSRLSLRTKILAGAGLALLLVLGLFREEIFAPWPPAPDVVATFTGGQITLADVEKHLASLVEDKEAQQMLKTPEGYALIVQEMVIDEIAKRWQADRKPDQDKEFSHVMQHITEEINLDELHTQMHKGQLGVTEGDIQAYYEANRKQFGEKTLTDVRDDIKTRLQSENEDAFVENYITGLKNKSSITRDFASLKVPDPAEWELRNYYDTNKEKYALPAQARVQAIHIPKNGDEKKAQEKANQILASIRSGGKFPPEMQGMPSFGKPIAAESDAGGAHGEHMMDMGSGEPTFEEHPIVKGEGESAYEEAVFRLEPGGVSEVIARADDFVIAKLVSKQSERRQSFEEVRAEIATLVRAESEKKYYADNAARVLFTLNGKQFTLGEFWEEYQELPRSFLASYQDTAGKQKLVEKIIERLLLYEDSLSQVSQTDAKEKKDEMRLKVLTQMLEQEEVDDKIKIEDKELQDYYDENKGRFVMPPKSKIRQIAIKAGETEDDHARAMNTVEEAYKKLSPGLLRKGADFATIAREYSEDAETKDAGGEVPGWVEEDMNVYGEIITHAYHEAVSAIPKGEIGKPFEASGYIYIVQVVDRTEPEAISLDDAKEFIRERLSAEKHDKLARELGSKLMKDNDVVIYTRTLKKVTPASGK